MKSIGGKAIIARIGFAAAFALGALLAAGAANACIANTKHNLSTSGTGAVHVSTGTEEICVFCHTPHGSDTSAPVPLWNKQLPTTSYTTYATLNSSTIDGTTDDHRAVVSRWPVCVSSAVRSACTAPVSGTGCSALIRDAASRTSASRVGQCR